MAEIMCARPREAIEESARGSRGGRGESTRQGGEERRHGVLTKYIHNDFLLRMSPYVRIPRRSPRH